MEAVDIHHQPAETLVSSAITGKSEVEVVSGSIGADRSGEQAVLG